ncbi:MAG: hypothetical protein AB1938_09355 [Myxococcota bacterium]
MTHALRWALLALVVSSSVGAQEPQPSLTPFPLELKRKPSGFSQKDGEDLQREFIRLVRKSGVLVPDSGSLDLAMKELKRQDCEREDECLKALALQGQTLYALYASVDYTLEGAVVATGRVVRDDGKVASPVQTVTLPKGKDAFKDVAKVALVQLLAALELAKLPPSRPVEKPPEVVSKPDEPKNGGQPPPGEKPPETPPVVKKTGSSGMKIAGWTMVGVGGAAAVAGVVVFATTSLPRTDGNGNVVAEDKGKVAPAQAQQTAGVAVLAAGLGVAAAGAVVLMLAPASVPEPVKQVSIVPVSGGAVAVFGGSF